MVGKTLLLSFALGCAARSQDEATPVESVLKLLEKLQKQTMEEGKKEAVAYDKFSCFCKEQADEKLYSITKKAEQIAFLGAEIKALTGDITKLNQDIAETNTQVDGLKKTCTEKQEERDADFNAYALTRDDLAAAIRGCNDAIELLKSGKAAGSLIQTVMGAAMTHGAIRARPDEVEALLQLADPGTAHGSQFHSGAIVEVMQNTLKTFKVNKNDLDAEEAEKKHTFNLAQSARHAQIKALQETLEQSEKEAAEKEQAKQIATEEKTKTVADRTADKTFMDDLTEQCEEKATAWDTRSKTRANELTAIAGAISTLKGEVVGNYGANKHLQLAQVKPHRHGHWEWVVDADKPVAEEKKMAVPEDVQDILGDDDDDSTRDVSFLQRRSLLVSPVKKALAYVTKEASTLKSKTLSNLAFAMKSNMRDDHFVKVRSMVKDLIAKLEADAAAEQDQKGWCDDEMKKQTEARDEAIANVEGDLASKTSAESKIAKLTEEINELLIEIAEQKKALNEAQQLRSVESKDNAKTLKDAEAGLAGVKKAMKILKAFYDNALIQTKKYTPPKADADGNTVGDLAPDTFEGDFSGNQDAASGIIGQLDVIKSDFEGTIDATKTAEAEAKDEFSSYKSEAESNISEKEGTVESKQAEVTTEKGNFADYKDDLSDHLKNKADALGELAKLKPACVDTGSDYAEKVARRNQEIEALKNAYVILDEMR
jgi:hypothetical protein